MINIDFNKKFNTEDFYRFFNNIVEFSRFVEVRIFDTTGKYNPFSKYASNIKELIKIIKEFNNERWLLYYGINTRQNMTRKNNEISQRRLFYFDIEDSGEKPPLTDETYRRQLSMTVSFIQEYLFKKYNIKSSALTISGRGLHLYYKFKSIDNIKYKKHFKLWYKNLQEEMDKKKPCGNIKFTDSVFDGSRIAALPGTNNFNKKYPEKPFRNILFIEKNIFNLEPMMKKVDDNVKRINKYRKQRQFKVSSKYNNDTIRDSPEYALLSQYSSLPEGKRNCYLIFAFQLLCRDNGITIMSDLYEELVEAGFDGANLIFPDEEYVYNSNIVTNWCLENYKWCVDNDFKLPYGFKKVIKRPFFKLESFKDFPDIELNSVDEVITYIKEFNKRYAIVENDLIKVYYDCIISKLKKNCDEKLFKFLKDNKLINKIAGAM